MGNKKEGEEGREGRTASRGAEMLQDQQRALDGLGGGVRGTSHHPLKVQLLWAHFWCLLNGPESVAVLNPGFFVRQTGFQPQLLPCQLCLSLWRTGFWLRGALREAT